VRYGYAGGRLKEIIKPDNSSIRITYGYAGAGGTQMVTATTHEEGQSERFEYYPSQRLTIYTNHSGVVTRYWHDEKHRTVKEEHGDGRVVTYGYNGQGQKEWERVNGFEIRYAYDTRGNIAEKTYGDGTGERYRWNGNDQRTQYIDRDGVVTEWRYDGRGNCEEIRKGGVQIFVGTYDNENRLTTSREGDRAERRYGYDGLGRLTSRSVVISGREIKERWEYDGLGRVTRYTDGGGRKWEYAYNARETVERTPSGLEKRYVYNNRKDLVQITEKDVQTGEVRETKISYDRRHLPIEVTDGAGNVIRYEYRADGEVTRKEQGAWYWEYRYEAGGRISEVRTGMTGVTEKYVEKYGYAWETGGTETRTVGRPGNEVASYRINPWGQVTTATNAAGETSTRTINGSGNITREQGASGGFYEYRYDAQGRLAEAGREGERGVQVKYNRDGSIAEKTDRQGNATRYAYEGRGLLEREIRGLGEHRYYYDASGRAVRRETASKNTTTVYYTEWKYDDSERTVTITAGGAYTERLYLNAWGEVVRRVDGEGNEKRYEYDGAGRLVKAADGYGRNTGYEWNEINKIKKITYADTTSVEYAYDYMGNAIQEKDALGISWAGEYDASGRLVKETGRPGIEKEYKYDALGRIVEVKSGGEVIERYSYTARGREARFTDGAGGVFEQKKNAYGELETEVNRLGDSQKYIYDIEGRITGSIAYSGKQTKAEYRDGEGLTITTYADGTRNIIERDLLGNIIRISGGTGTIRYRYDAGGKLAEQNDEGAGEITKYAYDKAGRRIRMQSGNRDVGYRYGKNGELLWVRDASQRLEVSYQYNVMGRETLRVYGNGVRQETIYDAIGRVILIRETDSMNRLIRAEGYLYDGKGRRSHSVDGEGRVTKYYYDNQSRLVSVLYPWTKEKAEADRKEAEEAGLYFTPEKGYGERYGLDGVEINALRELLNRAGPARGNAVTGAQMMWREYYTYDRNGNRASKTTPWGVIKYEYDAENRLVKKGDIVITNDKDGNTLSEKGLRYEARYEYNGQNRMAYSEVTSHAEKTRAVTVYEYDALGRRTLTRNAAGQAMRTVYDGKGFQVIREGETFRDGSLTTRFAVSGATANGAAAQSNQPTGERYRWVSDGGNGSVTAEDGYSAQGSRYGGRGVTLYGNGEAVAVSYSSSAGGKSVYLGKDVMGSVRTATGDAGSLEDRYEYDAFGQPYTGNMDGMMNLGYTGKPYDVATGMYNYGYRDYRPQAARFTTVDPIRDGNNWYAYVNNDPVNWIDLWGLDANDANTTITTTTIDPTYFTQDQWSDTFGNEFANNSCAATALINSISNEYTSRTGEAMTQQQGTSAMQAAVSADSVSRNDAYVNNWTEAANNMWGTTNQTGSWTYNANGEYQIHALVRGQNDTPYHFVNDIGGGQYRDPWNGNTGNVNDLNRQQGGLGPTRGLDFNE
jgi:RHS repeat-associated protein